MDSIVEFTHIVMQAGLSENEAKVFFVVFQLKSATIRDIYDISRVPRNKIYGNLDSLAKRRFVIKTGDKPVRYVVADLDKTFDYLRRSEMEKIARVEEYLKSFDTRESQDPNQIAFELHSSWAVENHLQTLTRRAKSELIFVVSNPEFFRSRFTDIQLKRFTKKLDLYIIVASAESAKDFCVPCYTLNDVFVKQFLDGPDHLALEHSVLYLVADRKAVLNVNIQEERMYGTVMYLQQMSGILRMIFEAFLKYLVPAV